MVVASRFVPDARDIPALTFPSFVIPAAAGIQGGGLTSAVATLSVRWSHLCHPKFVILPLGVGSNQITKNSSLMEAWLDPGHKAQDNGRWGDRQGWK